MVEGVTGRTDYSHRTSPLGYLGSVTGGREGPECRGRRSPPKTLAEGLFDEYKFKNKVPDKDPLGSDSV